ncbi:heme ABC exporter ATP-binding protein CcmA [Pseudolabrys sp. FHR47]|uniref:heme ABC exporter ATP-binding protein CcmA n=1 Tax=Pseudolabrys sp. FHR47 TaxID=2562284 RepID=UPI0010BEBB8E|nr:heme ABC exporter ATP-binding protein CcmA [Pseudolabrys sp. FHR47]
MQLICESLACERGGRQVFAGVNFTVSAGEAMVVTGRNGAGKSTLLRVIAGLLRAAEGQVTLAGGREDATLPEQAHYLGHLDAAKPSLTVRENLTFWADFLGASDEAAIESALEAVELDTLADLPAAYLSAGQKRRLSIARLLAVKRPVWLLDEPTSALDTQSQDRLAGFMRDHLSGGGFIVAATHGPIGLDTPRELKMGAGG